MSSAGSNSTVEGAAAVARARLSGMAGLDAVLRELVSRAAVGGTDPRICRELFFEPYQLAQQVEAPAATVASVAVLFQHLGAAEVWVRVSCPAAPEDEAATILETNEVGRLRSGDAIDCDHCGQIHPIRREYCEGLFALRAGPPAAGLVVDAVSLESANELLTRSSRIDEHDGSNLFRIVYAPQAKEITEATVAAVSANRPPALVPAPAAVAADSWRQPAGVLTLYAVGLLPVGWILDGWVIVLYSLVFLVVLLYSYYASVQVRMAPTALQRGMVWLGWSGSFTCVAAGASGLRIKAEGGEEKAWYSWLSFGEESWALIIAGVVMFTVATAGVCFVDYWRGWYERFPANG